MYCLELLYKLTDAQERAKFLGIQPKTYLGTDVLAFIESLPVVAEEFSGMNRTNRIYTHLGRHSKAPATKLTVGRMYGITKRLEKYGVMPNGDAKIAQVVEVSEFTLEANDER